MSASIRTWGLSGLCFALVSAFTLAFHYRAPFHDQWDIVPLFAAFQSGTLSLSDLFALHGNHWHASAYFVMLGLGEFTAMGHWAEALVSVLIAGFGFMGLVRILRRSARLAQVSHSLAWLIPLSAFFFFSLDQAANWLWGWQVAVFLNLAGALRAVERLTAGPPNILNTLLAALATAIAIYAFGTGWTLLPIGFALLLTYGALTSKTGLAALLIWTGLSALLVLHFVLALQSGAAAYSTTHLPDFADPTTLLGTGHYAINFVASPIVRFARDSAVITSVLGTAIIAWSIWQLARQLGPKTIPIISPFLALAAFSLGAGLLTALGRWEAYGPQQAFVSRYISFGTFFWIAVFGLGILALAQKNVARCRIVIGVLSLFFVLKIGNIPSVVQKSIGISRDVTTASKVLAQSYPETDPAEYQILHSPQQNIAPYLETLAEHKVSLFRDREAPAESAAR